MSEGIPVESIQGLGSVTVYLWPNSPDPVVLQLSNRRWARLQRKAERASDGDVGSVIWSLVEADISDA